MNNYKKNKQSAKGIDLHHALRHIDNGLAKQKQDEALEALRQSLSKANNIRCNDTVSRATMEMLHRHGIILAILPEEFKEYRIGNFIHSFIGVGVKNTENGICFYTEALGRTITLGTPSYIVIPQEQGQKTEECIVFYDLMDYLAYLTVMTHSKGSVGKPAYDVIILNDVKNIISSQDTVLSYKNINTFLPRGESFTTIINTYVHLSDNRVSDCSWFYQKKDYDTFLEFCEATFADKPVTGSTK